MTSEELYTRLQEQYPENFADCYDFGFGDGWCSLVETLTHRVIQADPAVRIQQVKEKFGGLRYYINSFTAVTGELIEAAEIASENTCEVCGEPGSTRSGSWIRTLCDTHAETKW